MSEFEPPRTYWDPYSRTQKPVLTEEQVQGMWPYATKDRKHLQSRKERKDALKASPMDDAMPNLPPRKDTRPLDAGVQTDAQMEFPFVPTEAKEAVRVANLGAAMMANMETAEERLGGDMVTMPNHYARFKIEPIRFIVENLGPAFLVGNIIKYDLRYDAKNGLEDLRKARRCQDMLIAYIEGNPDWWKAPK